jgi:hypothetical protein
MIRLQIFIEAGCWNCVESRRLVGEFAPQFPQVVMELVDLAQQRRPEYVFAVPTFVLNGKIISLGNPYPAELRRKLQEALNSA